MKAAARPTSRSSSVCDARRETHPSSLRGGRRRPRDRTLAARLKDTRRRTREQLRELPAESIDQLTPSGGSSIGAILYHFAIIEADWLFADILGTQETDWPKDLFPTDVREDGEHLSAFTGDTLDEHMDRLEKIRKMLVDTISAMTIDDLHTPRERDDYHVTPAWVLHHLMQHEAEHRSQIGNVREALGVSLGW